MWDLSSLTRGQTHVPCIARQTLNHLTTKEAPRVLKRKNTAYICNFNLWSLESEWSRSFSSLSLETTYWQSLERMPNLSNFFLNLGLNCAYILFEANFSSHLKSIWLQSLWILKLNSEIFLLLIFRNILNLFASGENSVWWVDEWSPSWAPQNDLYDLVGLCFNKHSSR